MDGYKDTLRADLQLDHGLADDASDVAVWTVAD